MTHDYRDNDVMPSRYAENLSADRPVERINWRAAFYATRLFACVSLGVGGFFVALITHPAIVGWTVIGAAIGCIFFVAWYGLYRGYKRELERDTA